MLKKLFNPAHAPLLLDFTIGEREYTWVIGSEGYFAVNKAGEITPAMPDAPQYQSGAYHVWLRFAEGIGWSVLPSLDLHAWDYKGEIAVDSVEDGITVAMNLLRIGAYCTDKHK